MGVKKKTSAYQKNMYKVYASENRSLKNRMKKLQRHIKKFPDDEQAIKALSKGLVSYRRKKPRNRVWNSEKRALAHLLRTIGQNGNLVLKWEQDRVRQNMVK